jgi:hypothetical protein
MISFSRQQDPSNHDCHIFVLDDGAVQWRMSAREMCEMFGLVTGVLEQYEEYTEMERQPGPMPSAIVATVGYEQTRWKHVSLDVATMTIEAQFAGQTMTWSREEVVAVFAAIEMTDESCAQTVQQAAMSHENTVH